MVALFTALFNELKHKSSASSVMAYLIGTLPLYAFLFFAPQINLYWLNCQPLAVLILLYFFTIGLGVIGGTLLGWMSWVSVLIVVYIMYTAINWVYLESFS